MLVTYFNFKKETLNNYKLCIQSIIIIGYITAVTKVQKLSNLILEFNFLVFARYLTVSAVVK